MMEPSDPAASGAFPGSPTVTVLTVSTNAVFAQQPNYWAAGRHHKNTTYSPHFGCYCGHSLSSER